MTSIDTIYALSSGRPPAAIAIVRVSGTGAGEVLRALSGTIPPPREARVAELRSPADDELLDRALILWLPGPASATGEDIAELHLHGGRAVVDAVCEALASIPGLRAAEPGEFTRRAFDHGKIDLNEAEGLADLLAAETQSQRRSALAAAGGMLSRAIETWRMILLDLSGAVEASIEYAEEEDVIDGVDDVQLGIAKLLEEICELLARPPAERLRHGIRVVIAGPPNAGKSALVNALSGRDAVIESATPGTTRDLVEVPLIIEGTPMVLTDTAGIRIAGDDVEAQGILRAIVAARDADILVWLGRDDPPPHANVLCLSSRSDVDARLPGRMPVSVVTGENLSEFASLVVQRSKMLLPREDEVALNRRQRGLVCELADTLSKALGASDQLVLAEDLRHSLTLCDRLVGGTGIEDVLDTLFGRFCIGK